MCLTPVLAAPSSLLRPRRRRGERAMDTQNGAAQKAAAARAYGAAHAHPVEAIQQDWLRTQLETKHFLMSSVYGAHLPMAMRMEMETLAKVQRLPGLPSSRVGLECLMGRDETIDFEDFLGLPQDSEQEPVDQRFLLEQRHNLLPNAGRCAPNANLGVSRGVTQPRGQAMVKDL